MCVVDAQPCSCARGYGLPTEGIKTRVYNANSFATAITRFRTQHIRHGLGCPVALTFATGFNITKMPFLFFKIFLFGFRRYCSVAVATVNFQIQKAYPLSAP